ncbi:GspH/FimT family pseudopilin [Pseudomonas sp. PDM13]|uniref:GspH/FimT family pseudopilin n=1 Tax=Pseudomonas sp. PDM13 TaxID=2769255 RepID=UPI0021DF7B6B|nr:GspH/FimT family pseudopilin [Pseudomonas sp. PDM13]MCU9946812.1 GspH/FimT family pseudopilin [Pseudomonas sp. PDM13]
MQNSKGFTLIELMVTILLLAIVTSLAAPAMGGFVLRQRVSGQASDFTLALALARSEAVKINASVSVVPMTSSNSGWSDGWCVGPTSISDCSDSAVVRKFAAAEAVTVTSANLASPPRITFLRDGTRGAATGTPAIKVSSDRLNATGEDARCVRVNPQGRAEIVKIIKSATCN